MIINLSQNDMYMYLGINENLGNGGYLETQLLLSLEGQCLMYQQTFFCVIYLDSLLGRKMIGIIFFWIRYFYMIKPMIKFWLLNGPQVILPLFSWYMYLLLWI